MLLTIDEFWLAAKGGADGLQADGFTPITETLGNFIKNDGHLLVFDTCMKPRNITSEQLIEGEQVVGAATAAEAMVNGDYILSFKFLIATVHLKKLTRIRADNANKLRLFMFYPSESAESE